MSTDMHTWMNQDQITAAVLNNLLGGQSKLKILMLGDILAPFMQATHKIGEFYSYLNMK